MADTRQSGKLRISEIFLSLQGESKTVGLPTVFVRLTGCPLRCSYCDTTYAFQGGEWYSIEDILRKLESFQTRYITVTGGEPLAQKDCTGFLKRLCDEGYFVSLETCGAMDVAGVDKRVVKVMDIKTPGSGECEKNNLANIEKLLPHDEVKFVICDETDYRWASQLLSEHDLVSKCEVLFSPSYGQLNPTSLADWIVRDQLPVRFQLQLHKILWGDEPGR